MGTTFVFLSSCACPTFYAPPLILPHVLDISAPFIQILYPPQLPNTADVLEILQIVKPNIFLQNRLILQSEIYRSGKMPISSV